MRPSPLQKLQRQAPLWIGLAAFLFVLPFVFRHQHARFDVETDFMWEYGPYARQLLQGDLPASFPYRGPGYHLILAITGLVIPNLFLAAKLLSAISFGLFASMVALLVRRVLPTAPIWLAGLGVLAQPLVVLHGWSVGTDMVFAMLALLSITLLVPGSDDAKPGRRMTLIAGLVAGYAFLVRPNGLFLVPACATILIATVRDRRQLVSHLGLLGLAFLIPTITWLLIFHSVHDSWPVTMNYRNLAAATWPELRQMTPDLYQKTFETEIQGYGDLFQKRGGALVIESMKNLPEYAGRYLVDVCGWVLALISMGGLWLAVMRRRLHSRAFWGVCAAGLWALLVLVPLYYEPRFGLFLGAPALILAAGLASSISKRGVTAGLAILLSLGVGLSITASNNQLSHELSARPYESAGAVIRSHPEIVGGVCARKPHISFAADRRLIGFPDATLRALPDSLRVRQAAFLFYGPAELELVPRYAGLLDPELIPPGLRLLRVEPGLQFGLLFEILPTNETSPIAPALVAALNQIDETLRQNGIHDRIRQRLATDAVQTGAFLIGQGRFAEAVPPLRELLDLFPESPDANRLLGWALVELDNPAEALPCLDLARTLAGESSELSINRARALLQLNRVADADSTLSDAISQWPDVADLIVLKGYASYHLGREAEARRWWEKAARKWPQDPRAGQYLGELERAASTP